MKKLLFAVCMIGASQFGCTEKVIIGDNGQPPSCETSTPPCTLPGEPNGSPASGCQPEAKMTVIAPADGNVATGTKGALFARIKISTSCGSFTLGFLSMYLAGEQPTEYCAGNCTAADAWNFSRPLLTSGSAVLTAAEGFHLAQMSDGKMAIEARFNYSLTVAAGEDVELEFLVDVAQQEALPGSLLGRRFRSSIGLLSTSGATLVIGPGTVADGGYQTITPAK